VTGLATWGISDERLDRSYKLPQHASDGILIGECRINRLSGRHGIEMRGLAIITNVKIIEILLNMRFYISVETEPPANAG
jgi:hypothetical protein